MQLLFRIKIHINIIKKLLKLVDEKPVLINYNNSKLFLQKNKEIANECLF